MALNFGIEMGSSEDTLKSSQWRVLERGQWCQFSSVHTTRVYSPGTRFTPVNTARKHGWCEPDTRVHVEKSIVMQCFFQHATCFVVIFQYLFQIQYDTDV